MTQTINVYTISDSAPFWVQLKVVVAPRLLAFARLRLHSSLPAHFDRPCRRSDRECLHAAYGTEEPGD
jgi:hypothetical protein